MRSFPNRIRLERLTPYLLPMLVLVAAGAIYVPFIRGAHPLLDDFTQLEGQAKRLSLGTILTVPAGFYRPLFFTLLKPQVWAFGWDHLWGYALCTVMLHFANGALVGWLFARIFRHPLVGLSAGCFWIINSACSETSFWTAAQNEGLGTFLALCALHIWLSALARIRHRPLGPVLGLSLAAALMLFLSLLAKESALGLPLFMVAMHLYRARQEEAAWWGKRLALCVAVILVAPAAFLAIRIHIAGLGTQYGNASDLFLHASPALNVVRHLGYQVLQKYGGENPFVIWLVMTGSMLYAGMIVAGALTLRPREIAAFALSWLAFIAPVIWIRQAPFWFLGGRLVYLAQLPLVFLLAAFVQHFLTRPASNGSDLKLLKPSIAAALLLTTCVAALVGLKSAQRRWTLAHQVTARTLRFIDHRLRDGPAVLEGIPHWFQKGPPMLDCLALRHYLLSRKEPVNPIACLLQDFEVRDSLVPFPDRLTDKYSDPVDPLKSQRIPIPIDVLSGKRT